jgi:protein N-lysine methyltransferase METTL21D
VFRLVGLTLAALGAEVFVSELPSALPLLHHNVASNEEILGDGSCRAVALSWGETCSGDIVELLRTPFDVVVGADIIYSEELFGILKQTINDVSETYETCLW